MKNHRIEFVMVVGMVLLLGGMIVSYPPVVGLGSLPLPDSPIDLDQAQDAALKGRPGAVVVDVEMDRDDGAWGYEFELESGIEVMIDASTGDVLKVETYDSPVGNEEDRSGMDQESND